MLYVVHKFESLWDLKERRLERAFLDPCYSHFILRVQLLLGSIMRPVRVLDCRYRFHRKSCLRLADVDELNPIQRLIPAYRT